MGIAISDFIALCQKSYPSILTIENLSGQIENTLSTEVMPLPKAVFQRVAEAVDRIYKFSHSPEWLNEISAKLPPALQPILLAQAPPSSVLMAYDFHFDAAADRLSLIEINTNASMFLPCVALYELHKLSFGDQKRTPLEALRDSFFAEWSTFSKSMATPRVAIVDENILKQRMYFEFLMYRDLLKTWGWQADVVDINDLKIEQYDFVYNRFVDFYLSESRSKALRDAWLKGSVFLSPQPREYLLMADKERLIDFYRHRIDPCFLPTELLTETIRSKSGPEREGALEDLWARRKQLFFKPKNMYGGKAAFRGNSISRKVFADIAEQDFVAQEFQPAGEFNGRKFDLRFFVYRNEIQLGCARLYTGQTTNFNSPGGGIAPLVFT